MTKEELKEKIKAVERDCVYARNEYEAAVKFRESTAAGCQKSLKSLSAYTRKPIEKDIEALLELNSKTVDMLCAIMEEIRVYRDMYQQFLQGGE
jgi:hypothetical protein